MVYCRRPRWPTTGASAACRSPPSDCGSSCASSTPKAFRCRPRTRRRPPAASTSSTSRTPAGTMKQLQRLRRLRAYGGARRRLAPRLRREGMCREPRVLTEERREARRKAGSKGGLSKAAKQKAKQNVCVTCRKTAKQTESKNSSEKQVSKPSSKLLPGQPSKNMA